MTEPKHTPRMTRKQLIVLPLISVLIGVAIALPLAEAAMRLFDVKPVRFTPRKFAVRTGDTYSECRSWRACGINQPSPYEAQGIHMGQFVPNVEFKMIYASNPRGYFESDNSLQYATNAIGTRGPEIALQKPPGTFRIIGIGDSFTFGTGVRDEDTFLRKLEGQLRQGGGAVEVLNTGTPGYNTRDEVAGLEQRWIKYDPDLVLITFYLNDAYSDSAFVNRGQELGIYLNQPGGLARYSYLVDYFQHMVRARKARKEVDDYYKQHFFTEADQALTDPATAGFDWADSRTALARAAQISRVNGFKLGLVIFPELYKLQADYPFEPIHRVVKKVANDLGVPVLDLLDTYRGNDPRKLWVHPQDHHPNEVAHQMAADAIHQFLERAGLLQ
jgi:lysophospholipase L1-like esterase